MPPGIRERAVGRGVAWLYKGVPRHLHDGAGLYLDWGGGHAGDTCDVVS